MDWQRIERELNLQTLSLSDGRNPVSSTMPPPNFGSNANIMSSSSVYDGLNSSSNFARNVLDPRISTSSHSGLNESVSLDRPRYHVKTYHDEIDSQVSRKQLHHMLQDIYDLSQWSKDSNKRMGQ